MATLSLAASSQAVAAHCMAKCFRHRKEAVSEYPGSRICHPNPYKASTRRRHVGHASIIKPAVSMSLQRMCRGAHLVVRLCLGPPAWLSVRGSLHGAVPLVSFAISVADPDVRCPMSLASGSNSSMNAVKDDPRDLVPNLDGAFFKLPADRSKLFMVQRQQNIQRVCKFCGI